jgi:hypothetical protein
MLAVAQPTRRIRVDLVAPDHAGDALAGEQQQVQERRRNADKTLDLTPPGELGSGAVRHGARL